jgi:acyl transferase domain-containing protein/thioesterase domain-containing protein
VVFLFGGQGSQYVNMGENLYRDEPLFRAVVDDCCDFLTSHLGRDLRELLFPPSGDEATARQSLRDTFFTQPAIFVIEYALARFWQSLGVQPAMMVGHSIGEFVAATLAGVWDLHDALRIVALRGRLMQDLPQGSMLSVAAGVDVVQEMLPASLQVASNNAPSLCVVAGPDAEVAAFAEQLEARNIVCRHLHTSHAFHSSMMDPILEPLRAEVEKIRLRAPALPFVSTVTGKPITAEEAIDPGYWSRHARATVEFSQAVRWLVEQKYDLFLECGPRATLCSLVRKQFTAKRSCTAVPSLAETHLDNAEWITVLFALGTLWQNGVTIDWDAFYAHEDRRRIPLPTYAFERQRYWVDPITQERAAPAALLEAVAIVPPPEVPAAPRESRTDRLAKQLVEILVPISGLEPSQISTTATFLEQGLDSLSLTRVAFAIHKEFQQKVSFSQLMRELPNVDMVAAHLDRMLAPGVFAPDVFTPAPQVQTQPPETQAASALEAVVAEQARTISRLVAMLEKSGAAQVHSSLVPAEAAPPQTNVRTVASTLPQRGIYFSSRLSDRLSASYNESMTLYIRGTVSAPKLTHAIERLVQRHDALRATFDESGTIMRIGSMPVHVPVADLSSIADAALRKHRLETLIAKETAQPFRLPDGPLFRSQIVVLAPDSAAVVFTGHHTICDGWSMDVLIHDLCAFYSEEMTGSGISLNPVNSYADYVRSDNERTQSAEFAEAREYWHRKFASGFQALVLPTDRPRRGRREHAARRLDRELPASLVHDLRRLAAQQKCSFFVLILGALALLLAQISRQRRFVIALPIAEQPVVGQPELVGHCVKMVPFAVELIEGEPVGDFLARVQRDVAAAQDHIAFPLVNLLEELLPEQALRGVVPISAGLTSVKKWNPQDLPQSGFTADYAVNPKSFESLEWYLNAIEVGDALELKCQFDQALFDDKTVSAWLAAFEGMLGELATGCGRDAMELAMQSARHPRRPEASYALDSAKTANSEPVSVTRRATAYAPPQTETEAALTEIWRAALRLEQVGRNDDFFELGGQSLSAVKVITRIDQAFGKRLPLASLVEAPTIRRMALLLDETPSNKSSSPLVALKTAGTKPPVFLFHSHGGNILEYYPLAQRLGEDRPVYALQAKGVDGSEIGEPRIEEVAASYVKEIRSVWPRGPYYLGGYCLGGTLALEAARQMRSEGEVVDLAFMINTPTPMYLQYPPGTSLMRRLYYHGRSRLAVEWHNLWSRSVGRTAAYVWTRGRRVAAVSLARAQMLWDNFVNGEPQPAPHSLTYHLERLAMAYDRAGETYEPQSYEGKVLQVSASRTPPGLQPDPTLGWSEFLTGEVTVRTVPGFRQNLLDEPAVGVLATLIQDAIGECGEPNPRDSYYEKSEELILAQSCSD